MNSKTENQILGVLAGVPIRCKRRNSKTLVNVTDLKKAMNATSKYRFDKFRAEDAIQEKLTKEAKKAEVTPIKNKKGIIAEVFGVLEVISGGDRAFQGTYASEELSKAYGRLISEDCYQWLDMILSEQKTDKVVKAKKVSIQLGKIGIDVYQLPDGEYRLSQTQAAEIIQKDEVNVRDFLISKSPEALPFRGLTVEKIAIKRNCDRS